MPIFDTTRSNAEDSEIKSKCKIVMKVDSKYPIDYEDKFMNSGIDAAGLKMLIIQQCAKLDFTRDTNLDQILTAVKK